jgi:hypothetical protein
VFVTTEAQSGGSPCLVRRQALRQELLSFALDMKPKLRLEFIFDGSPVHNRTPPVAQLTKRPRDHGISSGHAEYKAHGIGQLLP